MENKIILYISSADIQMILVDTPKPFQTHNGLYLWEVSKLVEKGYNIGDFVITQINCGMSTRDPRDLENSSFKEPTTRVDLYELHLSRKPEYSLCARC